MGKLKEKGFTLIELLVVMAIIGALTSLTIFSFNKPQQKANLDTYLNTLASDIKSQQLKAMLGDKEGSTSAQKFGLYISDTKYILFAGEDFSEGNPNNLTVQLKGAIKLGTAFESNKLMFNRLNGELINYDSTKNTITLKDSINQEQVIIGISKQGALKIIE